MVASDPRATREIQPSLRRLREPEVQRSLVLGRGPLVPRLTIKSGSLVNRNKVSALERAIKIGLLRSNLAFY